MVEQKKHPSRHLPIIGSSGKGYQTHNLLVVGSSPTFPIEFIKENFMENKEENTITISKAEHERLLADAFWLMCLEQAGVDSWQGFEIAQDIREELENE